MNAPFPAGARVRVIRAAKPSSDVYVGACGTVLRTDAKSGLVRVLFDVDNGNSDLGYLTRGLIEDRVYFEPSELCLVAEEEGA